MKNSTVAAAGLTLIILSILWMSRGTAFDGLAASGLGFGCWLLCKEIGERKR